MHIVYSSAIKAAMSHWTLENESRRVGMKAIELTGCVFIDLLLDLIYVSHLQTAKKKSILNRSKRSETENFGKQSFPQNKSSFAR